MSLPALEAATQAVKRYKRPIFVVAPDTGPTALRDENGQVKAVRQFIRIL